jgi:hypothetical protein
MLRTVRFECQRSVGAPADQVRGGQIRVHNETVLAVCVHTRPRVRSATISTPTPRSPQTWCVGRCWPCEPGTVSATLAPETDLGLVVHQASGMVSVQLHVSVADALVRLRAYAFANRQHLSEVGGAVIARELCSDNKHPSESPSSGQA